MNQMSDFTEIISPREIFHIQIVPHKGCLSLRNIHNLLVFTDSIHHFYGISIIILQGICNTKHLPKKYIITFVIMGIFNIVKTYYSLIAWHIFKQTLKPNVAVDYGIS